MKHCMDGHRTGRTGARCVCVVVCVVLCVVVCVCVWLCVVVCGCVCVSVLVWLPGYVTQALKGSVELL